MGLFGFGKGKTLYYPGCLTKGVLNQSLEDYKWIFNKLGIDFMMMPDEEVCCGLPILNAGYKKDVRKLAQKNFELFKAKGVKRILTNCPSCYHTFHDVYPELIREWDIEVEHATVAILKGLKKKGIDFTYLLDEEKAVVAYHDPCHLGRYSGIYEEPREVISLLGGKIIESFYNRKNSFCCGGGGGVRANFPEVAKAVAKKKSSFVPPFVGKIISPCGLCFANIESADKRSEEFSGFVKRRLEELK